MVLAPLPRLALIYQKITPALVSFDSLSGIRASHCAYSPQFLIRQRMGPKGMVRTQVFELTLMKPEGRSERSAGYKSALNQVLTRVDLVE